MNKTLATIAALLISMGAYAQNGQIELTTRSLPDLDAPITLPGSTAGPGSSATAFTFQVFLVGAGGSLTPITPTASFRTTPAGPAQQYIVDPGVGVDVPGTTSGQTVTLVAQAFNGTSFATSSIRGASQNFSVTLGGGTLPPALMTGLNGGFQLVNVPEPSTIALGIIGLGALLIRRRK